MMILLALRALMLSIELFAYVYFIYYNPPVAIALMMFRDVFIEYFVT